MADPEIGGAVVGEGCHFVDLMYWLLESEPIYVSAYSLPRGNKNIVGENNLVASLRFEDGSIGNLTYCTVGSMSGGGERVEAFAPGITISSEDFKHLNVAAETRTQKHSWFPQKGHAAQMQGFMESIRTGNPPEVQVRDGARATLCCLRTLQCASTMQPSSIDMSSLFSDRPQKHIRP